MAIGCHVSIHAPLLQGATLPDWDIVLGTTFQSTHLCGVRLISILLTSGIFLFQSFQSMHLCGCDRDPVLNSTPLYFNPHTREGCDVKSRNQKPLVTMVSIHAPAWGATSQTCCKTQDINYFNPRTQI